VYPILDDTCEFVCSAIECRHPSLSLFLFITYLCIISYLCHNLGLIQCTKSHIPCVTCPGAHTSSKAVYAYTALHVYMYRISLCLSRREGTCVFICVFECLQTNRLPHLTFSNSVNIPLSLRGASERLCCVYCVCTDARESTRAKEGDSKQDRY